MSIGTAPLTPEQTWRELDALVAFLQTLDTKQVAITYGWGCHAHGIQQPLDCRLDELIPLLHKNIAQGIYHLGEDNLYIEAHTPAMKITLCHDADLHFEADATLEAALRAAWEQRGHRVWPAAPKS